MIRDGNGQVGSIVLRDQGVGTSGEVTTPIGGKLTASTSNLPDAYEGAVFGGGLGFALRR